MSEFTKDFIKFIAEVLLILVILYTLFTDQGIISNTTNFLVYAEPNLIKDYLATALSVASYAPGEFSSSIKVSGNPYDIKFYKENGVQFISVKVKQSSLINTKFSQLSPAKILTNCTLEDQTIHIAKGVTSRINVKNDLTNECELKVVV